MNASREGFRRRSRAVALQVLYAIDVAREEPQHETEAAFEAVASHFELPHAARAFAEQLVKGVRASREEIDALIRRYAENWRLERMPAVDRNILRLAVYELRDTATPPAVVIDEAIELARRYAGETAPAFVNGILDAVARSLESLRSVRAAHGEDKPA